MVSIRNHKGFPILPMDISKAVPIMREAYKRLSGIRWISAGTALGLYRDGDFINGDTDIDIAMIGHPGIDDEIKQTFQDYDFIRDVYMEKAVMQMAFIKNGIILDLYFHWKVKDYYVNVSEYGITKTPDYIYEGARELPTKYGTFLFPNPVSEYFTIRYGLDWRTPKSEKPIFLKSL